MINRDPRFKIPVYTLGKEDLIPLTLCEEGLILHLINHLDGMASFLVIASFSVHGSCLISHPTIKRKGIDHFTLQDGLS